MYYLSPVLSFFLFHHRTSINNQISSMPSTSPSSSPQSSNQEQAESLSPLHPLIISLITTVGGYVLFQSQIKRLSLFDEHGNIMRAFFVILFLYAMGLMAEFKLQSQTTFLPIIKSFTPLFGLLVVVLLLFILSLSGLAASIVWALLVVEPTIRLFQQIVEWLGRMISHFHPSHTATNNFDMEESDSSGIQVNEFRV